MAFRHLLLASSATLIFLGSVGYAQTPNEPEDEQQVLEQVRVVGSRFVKQALTEIAPEVRLSSEDIAAYGASTIEELLEELGPEIASGRGRSGGSPIVLVDGVRVASFREVRSYPPEAIHRMDVLPEEASLKFGYGANQRVINIVLKPEFSAVTLEVELGGPTEGAGFTREFEAGYIGIKDSRRTSFDGEIETDDGILEADRGLADATGDDSLTSESEDFSLAGSFHKPFDTGYRVTLSGDIEQRNTTEFLGLSELDFVLPAASPFSNSAVDTQFSRLVGVPGPLMSERETLDANASLSVTGDIDEWFLTSITKIGQSVTDGSTDRTPDATAFQASLSALDPNVSPDADLTSFLNFRSELTERTTTTVSTNVLANGRLMELPAGRLSTGLSADLSHTQRKSETRLDGSVTQTDLDRQIGKLQGSFDVPLIDEDMEIAGFHSLTANVTASVSEYSDFGRLFGFDGTLSWSPVDDTRLLFSYTHEEGPPSMSQLGDTISLTPNSDVFDFVRGESVVATRIEGGSPDLDADTRQVFKLSGEIKPFEEEDLRLSVTYLDTRIDDPIGSFPSIDGELETAFPSRFVRDANGTLISYDTRPINYVEETRRDLEWRLTWRKTFSSKNDRDEQPRRGRGQGRTAEPPGRGNAPPAAMQERMMALMNTEEGRARLEERYVAFQREKGELSAEEARARFRELVATEEGRTQLREELREQFARGAGPNGASSNSARRGPPPGAGGGGGFRGRGGRGGNDPRIFVSLRYVMHLEDQRILVDGLQVQDFLSGSAKGSNGGTPDHEFLLYSGFFYKDFGTRMSVNWKGETQVDAGSGGPLTFSDYATTNLRVFYNVRPTSELAQRFNWLQGARFSLEADNLFDEVVQVSDASGLIPLRYEGDRLDPRGQVVRLSVRKQF